MIANQKTLHQRPNDRFFFIKNDIAKLFAKYVYLYSEIIVDIKFQLL